MRIIATAMETSLPIQIGLHTLPEAGSENHYRILNQWLEDCDENHSGCQPDHPMSLPTRLIDLGVDHYSVVRLTKSPVSSMERYVALSHPWGDQSRDNPHFCTFWSNIKSTSKVSD
jgi:hypothetical protein